MKNLFIIDGNSFCYRAFYAVKKLSTSQGKPTNAIYGFISMLNKLVAAHNPYYLAVTFDLKGPTFRHEKFAGYKIQRKPMPDELSVQIPTIKEILAAYRIPIFEKKGYEADDIIATLTRKLSAPDLQLFVVTGDKDILQTVTGNVKVLNPHKGNIILDEEWIKQRYGVSPEKIVDIIGLAGDSSDNIPGVPGIGEATAIELIKKFGTLEAVLANIEKIGNKAQRKSLEEFSEQAKMSKELAQLDFNVPQVVEKDRADLLTELKMAEADTERLIKLFRELEFKSWLQKLLPENKSDFAWQLVPPDKVDQLLQKTALQKDLAIYPYLAQETPSEETKILGIALVFGERECFFLSLEQIPLDILKPVLENGNINKIGHDLKHLQVILSGYGINLQGIFFDTRIAAYLLNPAKGEYTPQDLAWEFLNVKLDTAKADLNKDAAFFCCQCAAVIFRLSQVLKEKIEEKNLYPLFRDIEMPLVEVLADMEITGVCLDKDWLLNLSSEFEKRLYTLTKDIYEMAGGSFNINSPRQLSMILFERLNLPKIKKTKTRQHSTDTEVLKRLAKAHPIAGALLEYREIAKLKSTYIDGLIKLLNPKTDRIHPLFIQTGTATGRLACSRPNLQNIPVKTELGRKIRQAFVADKQTSFLLSADYSQIELRILAHLSSDKTLLSAFQDDLDIHTYTAALVFGVTIDKVTPPMRSQAKTVNFGITYGMSAFGLAKDLSITQEQAQAFIDAYFQRYPGVKDFMASQIDCAKKCGYVTTLLKRRRYIPEIESSDENVRQFARRIAINTPVQGSASDLIKAAMLAVFRALKGKKLGTKMILQIHDELLFTVPQEELAAAREIVAREMENVIALQVPLKVSVKTGRNWLEMQ
ncbi:MAG: DNA polymerase I [Candidatus Omnitrophota bacterium]